jgi:transglutaminase-like putative cysteine protease
MKGGSYTDSSLRSTNVLDWNNPLIKTKTEELTKGLSEDEEKVKALFYFVRDKIKYKIFFEDLSIEQFKASSTLKRGYGFCIPKASLLTAMARGAGIRAKLHFADIRSHRLPPHILKRLGTDLMTWHGYVELYINNNWLKANPAFDIELCNKYDIIPVDFSGSEDALFEKYDRKGRLHIDYIKDLGIYDDLPYDEMIEGFKKVYKNFQINTEIQL